MRRSSVLERGAGAAVERDAAAGAAAQPFDLSDPSTWPAPPAHEPPLDDRFVRWFVLASVHVRRFLPFYAGAVVWLGLMIVVDPIGVVGGGSASSSSSASSFGAASPGASRVSLSSAPVAARGEPFVGGVDASGGAGEAPAFSVAPEGDVDELGVVPPSFTADGTDFDESSSSSSSSFTFSDDSLDFGADLGPTPLMIVESGYASATGGTPVEAEPPNGGLPVTVSAGQEVRRSYVRLAGTATVLALRTASDPGSTEADELATVRVCRVASPDWTATRQQPLSSAPAVDMTLCATGSRDGDGVWTFDLGLFEAPTDRNGFAIVPGPNTGGTFQVVFSPAAVAA